MTQQDIEAITEIIRDTQKQLSDQILEFQEQNNIRFEKIEAEMREGFDRVNTTLDGIASRLDIDDAERVALSAQVDRHEDWIVEAAPATGINYVPGA